MILFGDQFQKRLMLFIAGISFFCFMLACQQKQDQTSPNEEVKADSIKVSDLQVVIASDSATFAMPSDIVAVGEDAFAVYDYGFNKVLVFNNEGEKQFEFGRTGRGPGEWDPQMKAGDLSYSEGQFLLNSRGQYKFDLYDSEGNYLKSIAYPQYLNNSHKALLDNRRLLVATEGREESLAAILDMDDDGTIEHTVGAPEVPPSEKPEFNKQRLAFSKGEIPDQVKNKALVVKTVEGYALLMNALGELRLYSGDGGLLNTTILPESVRKPIFNYVVELNQDGNLPPNSVMSLGYIQEMKTKDDLIYLLTRNYPNSEGIHSHLLIYNSEGELQKHITFIDDEQASFLYDFFISAEGRIYLLDAIITRVLKYDVSL